VHVPRDHGLARLLSIAFVAGALVAVAPASSGAADRVDQALARLDQDAHRRLTIQVSGDGTAEFVGVPARAEVDNPAVTPSTTAGAAGDAAIARYGAALGTAQPGTTVERAAVQPTATGDVVRYQQKVGDLPVLGGEIVVGLREDGELSSILARTTDETAVGKAALAEDDAAQQARAAFTKSAGPGAGTEIDSQGRWLLDAGLIGGSDSAAARTVWRFEVTRGAAERRLILVDDHTGGVLMNVDEVEAVNRVVCDDANTPRDEALSPPTCTGPTYARSEGGPATGSSDVNGAYDLAGPVSELYAALGIDLTSLIGRTVSGGAKALAQTVNFCPTGAVPLPATCPGYDNAFWNGSQMYYGTGYAAADDIVAHEMTHGVTEHTSNLFYWGQSGAINESISDIMGEIVDHRHATSGENLSTWEIGEDLPGPGAFRDLRNPSRFLDPDSTSSSYYKREGVTETTFYPDSDGVHTNSGVGNKTFYLISQGGSFNGQTISGIDAGDSTLLKSARLWLLVDQSLSSGSDYADLAAVLDQSCQALLAAGTSGFSADDCESVHRATLATELVMTPQQNPTFADAEATCGPGTSRRILFDSETGTPAAKFLAGPTWVRGSDVAHSGGSAWMSDEPSTAGASSLTMSAGVALPAGQPSYLFFQRWNVLDYFDTDMYDAMTVKVDDLSTPDPPLDLTGYPGWENGPNGNVFTGTDNPAAGQAGFGFDSRGFTASRLDLSAFAGTSVKAQFTMATDSSLSFVGLALDDIQVFTCDTVASAPFTLSTPAQVTGDPRVGGVLKATLPTWTTTPTASAYQWLRDGTAIEDAVQSSYSAVAADAGSSLAVRVTASGEGRNDTTTTSSAVGPIALASFSSASASISGSPRVGQALSASSTWSPAPTSRGYEWLRNGSVIPGASTATYRLEPDDLGTTISVRVTVARPGFGPGTVTSSALGPVTTGLIAAGKPRISGTPALGQTLTAAPGSWSPVETALAFQWLRNGVPIAGASSSTYVATSADLGTALSVRVSGTRAGYTPTSATSAATSRVVAGRITPGKPSIRGSANVGTRLRATSTAWAPSGVALRYQWLRNGKPIRKATKATYQLVAADRAKKISVTVTGTRSGYQTKAATSKATGKVKAKPKKRR
jgi:Zn-dependent metalloprotease